ncbi:uncharacterized protein K02A2.6 [Trichonephila clavipes]|uniref:Uncharacterized protein K02A2.6 n=1 Tax=Trichonephila clavipes TaxID=2585209 RepID=A0A8X6WCK6_TRICX|nr:uncharacterized protein K02A2.6 [Trichonephila clavipes]
MTKVRLELLTDIDMPLFIEKGIRGGVAMMGHRYAKANNVYLSTYDSSLPTSDASPVSIGCVLSHVYPDGSERPIAFASRTLSGSERKYSQIDKETLAIAWPVKKFYLYLKCTRFTLITDRKLLVAIFGSKRGLPVLTATRLMQGGKPSIRLRTVVLCMGKGSGFQRNFRRMFWKNYMLEDGVHHYIIDVQGTLVRRHVDQICPVGDPVQENIIPNIHQRFPSAERRENNLNLQRVETAQNSSEDLNKGLGCQVIYSQFGLAIHQNDHQARRRFVELAQNEIAVVPDFHKRILFSDEAHFWLNGYVNKQNCRIWSEANPQVYVETPLHPEKLTVWCALWAGGILLQKR